MFCKTIKRIIYIFIKYDFEFENIYFLNFELLGIVEPLLSKLIAKRGDDLDNADFFLAYYIPFY